MIQIKAKIDGFWRCGIQHSAAGVTYADDAFEPEILARLKAEPQLEVTEIPGAREPEKEEAPPVARKPGQPKAAKVEIRKTVIDVTG